MPIPNQAERFINRLRKAGRMAEADAAEKAYLEAKASGIKMKEARAVAEAAALRVGRQIRAATGLFPDDTAMMEATNPGPETDRAIISLTDQYGNMTFCHSRKGPDRERQEDGVDIADHAKILAKQAATINAQAELIEDLESIVRDQDKTIEDMKQDIDVICKHYDESQETLRDHRDQLEVVQGQVDMLLKHMSMPSRDHLPKAEKADQ